MSDANLRSLTQNAASHKVLPSNIAGATHRGQTRIRNEDAFACNVDIGLLVVADGVGGHGDGAWASQTAVRLFTRFIERTRVGNSAVNSEMRERIIARALQFAHRHLRCCNHGVSSSNLNGTTIVGLWAPPTAPGEATAFNVGDSRLFHFSPAGINKMSRDHSLHQLWLDSGRCGKEPSKRTITQALGISDPLTPHILSFAVNKGDVAVACTDGLSGTVSPARMDEILSKPGSASRDCERLITEALQSSKDNITAVVFRF